jgi:hypothetical protein
MPRFMLRGVVRFMWNGVQGATSTHILTALGAERVAFCDYATWQGEHADMLRGLPALGHAGMSMMVATL